MTHEIKLQVGSPHVLRDHLTKVVASLEFNPNARNTIEDVLAQVEAQMPKPAIEEPKGFGSIVRAGYDEHTDRVLWVRAQRGWYAETEHGFHSCFAGLHDPEVLRIGVGERPDVAPEETDDYKLGASDFILAALRQLRQLRSEAITSERKNAYDVAIKTVEGLQP